MSCEETKQKKKDFNAATNPSIYTFSLQSKLITKELITNNHLLTALCIIEM